MICQGTDPWAHKRQSAPKLNAARLLRRIAVLCCSITLLCCAAAANLVTINKAHSDTHGAEKQHFILQFCALSKLTTGFMYVLIAPNIRQNCRKKRQICPVCVQKRKEKNLFNGKGDALKFRVTNSDQNIRILKCYNTQQFLLNLDAHTHAFFVIL